MNPAFWDTSALVPLCVHQQPSAATRQLVRLHGMAVWWATPVDMRSAFQRLLRMGEITAAENAAAGSRLEELRRGWHEWQPGEALRSQAETFLLTYPLRAADALQLASAWVWSSGRPSETMFISGDTQLLHAAQLAGFQIEAV